MSQTILAMMPQTDQIGWSRHHPAHPRHKTSQPDSSHPHEPQAGDPHTEFSTQRSPSSQQDQSHRKEVAWRRFHLLILAGKGECKPLKASGRARLSTMASSMEASTARMANTAWVRRRLGGCLPRKAICILQRSIGWCVCWGGGGGNIMIELVW